MINVLFLRSFNFSSDGISIKNYKAGEKHEVSERCFEIADSLKVVEVVDEKTIIETDKAKEEIEKKLSDQEKKSEENKVNKIAELEISLKEFNEKLDKAKTEKEIKKFQTSIDKIEKTLTELKK